MLSLSHCCCQAMREARRLPAAVIPPGRASALLERRPNIRQAEQQLVSANARIGVAKALFFPQVALTGSAGLGAVGVDETFFVPQGLFAIGPLLTLPIFNAGRIRAGVESTVFSYPNIRLSHILTEGKTRP